MQVEPLRSFAEYEVAVSTGTNSQHNMYSSVDEAKEEAHQYASLHPATIDREEHVCTPPLVRTTSPASPQHQHTYTSLEQGKRVTETKVAADQGNDIESSDSEDEPAHTYLYTRDEPQRRQETTKRTHLLHIRQRYTQQMLMKLHTDQNITHYESNYNHHLNYLKCIGM